MKLTFLAALVVTASSVAAQTAPRSASDAANAFSLNLPAPPQAAPVPDGTPAAPVAFTLDTPIAQLIADPRAKAVLDKDVPGLSDDSNLPKFQSYSLRQFQPMTGGQMSMALLEKTGADLAAIGGTSAATLAPAPYVPIPAPSNKRLDTGR